MKIVTTISLPPLIREYFDKALLSYPSPKLCDGSKDIRAMIEAVQSLWYKLDSNPIRKARCEKLLREILDLYERSVIKEKERETEKDHKTQEFGYSFVSFEENDRDVFYRLVFGRKAGTYTFRHGRNRKISKI